MFNLFRKHVEKVDSTYEERLIKAERNIAKLRSDVLDVYTDIDALRSKVLRKIQQKREDLNTTNEEIVPNSNPGRRLFGGKSYGRT